MTKSSMLYGDIPDIDAAIQQRQQSISNGAIPGTVGRDLSVSRWDGKLPTQEKIVQANQSTQERMANWDYKTAKMGPNGETLPQGAQGWDPRGNAYYGEGLGGWWKKLVSVMKQPIEVPEVGEAKSQYGYAGDVNVPEAAAKAMSAGAQYTNRIVKEGFIGGGLEVLNQIEEQTERWLGGTVMYNEQLADKSGLPNITEELQETSVDVSRNLYKNILPENAMKTAENAGKLSEAFSKFMPMNILYNSIRTGVFGIKNSFATARGEGEELPDVKENYEAARMAYTALYDEGRKAEFIRKVRAGENPDLVRMELENPYVEMIMGMVIDPIDMIPFNMIKRGQDASRFADMFDTVPELKKIIEGADDFSDAQRATIKTSEFIQAVPDIAKKIGGDLDGYRLKNGIFDLTAQGKQAVIGERVNDTLKWVSNTLAERDPDTACQVMEALVKMHSDKLDEVGEAVSTLAAQADARPLFSRGAFETGYVLKNIGGDDPAKFLDELNNTQNIDDLLELVKGKTGKTLDAMFPSVRELAEQGEKVAPLTKFAANVDFMLKGQKNAPITAINKFFSAVYMGMSPGYAFRNMMTNSLQSFVDLGIKGGVETVGSQLSNMVGNIPGLNKIFGGTSYVDNLAEKALKWNGGTEISALRRGFGTPLSGADIGNLGDDVKFYNVFQKISEKAEEGASIAVVSRAFEDAMLSGMKEGVAIPKMDELIQAGMDRGSADTLIRLIRDNYGDVDEAVKVFREATSIGSIDVLKTSEWLNNKKDIDFLQRSGAYDSLLDAVRNAKTKDEAIKYIDELEKEMRRMAKDAGKELPAIDPDNLKSMFSGEILGDVGDAVNDGYIKSGDMQQAIRQSNIILNNAVKTSYGQAMTDALQDAINKFPGTPELKDLSKRLKGLSTGPDLHYAKFQGYRDIRVKHIRAIPTNPKPERLTELWESFFKDAPMPKDLTRQSLVDACWKQYFDNATEHFRLSREQYVGLSEKWFGDLQKITGQKNYPLLTQAREYLDQSHQFDNVRFVMKDGAIRWAKTETHPNELINTVNKYLKTSYKKLDEISVDELNNALKLQAETKAFDGLNPSVISGDDISKVEEDAAKRLQEAIKAGEEAGVEPLNFPYDGGTPSPNRVYSEGFKGGLDGMFYRLRQSINENWGNMRPIAMGDNIDSALPKWIGEAKGRIARQRLAATEVATHTRDKILLNYNNKMNFDMGLSYLMPYQFWHTRTYANWMKRIVTNTNVISAYGKYREMMQSVHAGMPDWWKYNINTNELFGLNSEHPLYFNLEATLNPLNALVGVDFNDPQKRVDYWTTMLDDISKLGPSVWTPLNWATALALYKKGKDDAGARWLGRGIPQTATIKAATSLTGLNTKGGTELDPFVNFIMGGADPYERNRIGRGLAALEGKYTTAQLQEAAQMQSGPIWDEAAQLATNARAPGQLASYFLGVGFKGRSEADMQTDYMYSDYFQLMNMRPDLSPQEFSTKMDEIRQKYPFMDTVLISRKGGYERDTAYAYSVMRRIPPGQTNEVAELAGIDPRLLSRFFDDKGAIEKWPKQDRDELINGMITIGAVLDLPATATRTEWTNAKNAYVSMKQQGEAMFGKNIWDEADGFFNAEDRDQWLAEHPNAKKAMDWKDAYIVNDPMLSQYYGGITTIERYYNSWFASEAEMKFGKDIQKTLDEYNQLKNNSGPYKAYKKDHPEIGQYYDMKDAWKEKINENITAAGLMLKEGLPAFIREDLPEDMSFSQQDLLQGMQEPQKPMFSWSDWKALLPNDIEGKLYTGEQLTEKEEDRLIQKANALGIGYEQMIEMINQSIGLTK